MHVSFFLPWLDVLTTYELSHGLMITNICQARMTGVLGTSSRAYYHLGHKSTQPIKGYLVKQSLRLRFFNKSLCAQKTASKREEIDYLGIVHFP